MRWRHFEISGGFLLLTAVLYYFDSENLLPWAFLACALHEVGHFLVIRLFGGRVTLLRLTCVGAEMRLSVRCPLCPSGEIAAALAGPTVNLLAAIGAGQLAVPLGEGVYLFAGLNLALCAFNLLPVSGLDGGRALHGVLCLRCHVEMADAVLHMVSVVLCAGLLLCSVVLWMVGSGNITLLITAGWLLLSQMAGNAKKK